MKKPQNKRMKELTNEIRAMVDRETAAWDRQDAEGACKGYTKIGNKWMLIFHTGLLEYDRTRGHRTKR